MMAIISSSLLKYEGQLREHYFLNSKDAALCQIDVEALPLISIPF